MKKLIVILCAFVFFSCHGKLTDEQKKKIRLEREMSQIRKINEATILQAAFEHGRNIAAVIEKQAVNLTNQPWIDSVQQVYHIHITCISLNDSSLHQSEAKIIEAYAAYSSDTTLIENVQKIGKDSVLYTKPLFLNKKNETTTFSKVLALRIANKEIIRTIK